MKNFSIFIQNTLDTITAHSVTIPGYLFFHYLCRGQIFNEQELKNTLKHHHNFILASNHESYLDWIIIWAIFRYKYKTDIIFLAKEKLFNHFFWGRLMRHGKCVKVSNDGRSVLDDKSKLANSIIAIFPEGTRSRTGELQEFRSGVVVMAKKYGMPILPVGLNGFYEAWPPTASVPTPNPLKIVFGELLTDLSDLRGSLKKVRDSIIYCKNSNKVYEKNFDKAFFDVDSTLTNSNIGHFLYFIKKKELGKLEYLLWKLRISLLAPILFGIDKISRPLAQVVVYQMYTDVGLDKLDKHAEAYYEEELSKQIFPDTHNLLIKLKERGTKVTLLSTNLRRTLKPLSEDLGVILEAIDLNHLTQLTFKEKLNYLSNFKKNRLAEESMENVIGVGDSKYDFPIFDKSSYSVLKLKKSTGKALINRVNNYI